VSRLSPWQRSPLQRKPGEFGTQGAETRDHTLIHSHRTMRGAVALISRNVTVNYREAGSSERRRIGCGSTEAMPPPRARWLGEVMREPIVAGSFRLRTWSGSSATEKSETGYGVRSAVG